MGTDNTWGGRSWRNLIAEALRVLGQDLSNTSVLELGFRDGSMSFAFARRGATVVGAEINAESVTKATTSARRLHLPVTFMHYDGSPDNVPGRYDVVFTKSVLVLTDLAQILPAIDRKLNPGGRILFIKTGPAPHLCVLLDTCSEHRAHTQACGTSRSRILNRSDRNSVTCTLLRADYRPCT